MALITGPRRSGAPQPALLCLSARTRPSLERLLADYAALVLHLAENVYINGECIRLDGGIRMAPR